MYKININNIKHQRPCSFFGGLLYHPDYLFRWTTNLCISHRSKFKNRYV